MLALLSGASITREVFHPSNRLGGPPLDSIQHVHVLPVLVTPKPDALLQYLAIHALDKVSVTPFLQPVKEGRRTLWITSGLSSIVPPGLVLSKKLAESPLSPNIQIIKKSLQRDWDQDCSLGYATS
ncbi:hypothetical protein BTVI_89897 [Pitangus sulphuratus]|nr:hypothetical protein BTVI_89897 [Pitangus sulphuratus]